ncbi:hypothetical protein THIOSC13_1680001 [uncultured Thiomicrorhabdus sp.]
MELSVFFSIGKAKNAPKSQKDFIVKIRDFYMLSLVARDSRLVSLKANLRSMLFT